MGAFQVERALAVYHDLSTSGANKNIATLRRRHELHLVAQAVTTATGDRDSQKRALSFAGNEASNLGSRRFGQTDEIFISFPHAFRKRSARRGRSRCGRRENGRARGRIKHVQTDYRAAREFIKRRATLTALAKLVPRAEPRPAIPKAVP